MKNKIWIIVIIALIAAGFLLYRHFKQQKIAELEKQLQQRIHDETDGLYKLTWDKLEVDEVRKRLRFQEIRLETDSSLINGEPRKEGRSLPFIVLRIPTLEINGYKIDKKDKIIEVDEIKLLQTELVLSTDRSEQDSTGNWQKEIKEQLLRKWNDVKIHRIAIEGLSAKLMKKNLDTPQVQIKQASVELTKLYLNKNAVDTGNVIDSFGIVSLSAKEFAWFDKSQFFKYTLQDIDFNEAEASLLIKRFMSQPQLSKQVFMSRIPHRKNYLTADLSEINFQGFRLLFDSTLQIRTDNLVVGRSSITIDRDHRLPHDGKNRVGSYPQQQLMRVPFLLHVKALQFKDLDLTYSEVNPNTKQTGKMRFSKIAATVKHLTNDRKELEKENRMNLVVNCFFEEKIPLSIEGEFLLGHPAGAFQLDGQVGPVNLIDVNQVAMPMGSLRFESGKISKYYFKMSGNDQGVKGQYRLLYEDLKIAALDPEKKEGEGDKKAIMSLMFNLKLINSNPGSDGKLRSPSLWTERVTDRSILHLAWQGLFNGMMQTAMPGAKSKPPA
jgi:hypothetical protein